MCYANSGLKIGGIERSIGKNGDTVKTLLRIYRGKGDKGSLKTSYSSNTPKRSSLRGGPFM